MRAHRLRHQDDVDAVDIDALTAELRRRSQLVAACVYECPSCQERYLGERRCPECHLFNRNLGLGGTCSGCDQPVVLAELVPRAPAHAHAGAHAQAAQRSYADGRGRHPSVTTAVQPTIAAASARPRGPPLRMLGFNDLFCGISRDPFCWFSP